jgi:hypothetical protein
MCDIQILDCNNNLETADTSFKAIYILELRTSESMTYIISVITKPVCNALTTVLFSFKTRAYQAPEKITSTPNTFHTEAVNRQQSQAFDNAVVTFADIGLDLPGAS